MKWQAEEKGMFTLYAGEHPVLTASAAAVADGEELDSRRALASHEEKTENGLRLVYEFEGGLCLEERLRCGAECAEAQCAVFRKNGEKVTTNSLTPLVARGKGDEPYLWRDLRSKMLLVPYDNDMWMRYEEIALRAGARSYDVTVLFHDSLKEALLIGAMDFDVCNTIQDIRYLAEGVATAGFILEKAGVDPSTIGSTVYRGAHPGGTAPIGKIVDSNQETEIGGLFVSDASVLPISPGKPPILTILSLSKRLSDYLKNK